MLKYMEVILRVTATEKGNKLLDKCLQFPTWEQYVRDPIFGYIL
jgi:hypothetical protein